MSQTPAAFSESRDVAVFARAFAEDDDLGRLGHAARRMLATGAALFYRHGAAATSIRDITNACGLSPGALYRHFASKDDMLELLVRNGHDRLEGRVRSALAEAGSAPAEQLAAYVGAYVTAHLERPEMAQLVRREYRHLPPKQYRRIVACRRRMRTQLVDILRAGRAAGVFDPDHADDPSSDDPTGGHSTGIAVMVLDMCSRTSEWYDHRRSDPPDVLARRYVAAALRVAGASGSVKG